MRGEEKANVQSQDEKSNGHSVGSTAVEGVDSLAILIILY
jgi:hypothetical protein